MGIISVDKLAMTALWKRKFSGEIITMQLDKCLMCGTKITASSALWLNDRPYCFRCHNNYFTYNELIPLQES